MQSGRAETVMRAQTRMAEMGMWAQTSLVATSIWARMCTGRSGYVVVDAKASMITVGADMFPEMIVSQKLVLG